MPQRGVAPPTLQDALKAGGIPMTLNAALERGGVAEAAGEPEPPPTGFRDDRSPVHVMRDQAAAPFKGLYNMVTGLPGFAGEAGMSLVEMLSGKGSARGQKLIGDAVKSTVMDPLKFTSTMVRGIGALVAPESVPAPSSEEFQEAGEFAGPAALGIVTAGPGTGRFMRNRPVRKGYTTISPQTLKPELPVGAVKAEIGVKLPKVESGAIVEFSEPVNLASKALGGDASLEAGNSLRRVFNEAFPDLKQAQQQNPYLRGAMDSPQKFRAAVQWARNRVWREGIEPAFKASGEVDLSPVAQQLISEIPESIRVKTPKRAQALEKAFTKMFDGKVVKAETLHEFAKEARASIQSKLAQNSFDRQAAFGTPDGKMAESFNTALRDRLYQHVQEKTGVDLRPTAERYGALSELEQTALGLAEPQSFLEKLFTSYTFPTKRAVAARAGEQLGKHMISDMKLLERAFDRYKLEPQKITQPFRLRAAAPVSLPPRP